MTKIINLCSIKCDTSLKYQYNGDLESDNEDDDDNDDYNNNNNKYNNNNNNNKNHKFL